MKSSEINIDFKKMEDAFRDHVRRKALKAKSTIVYKKNNQLIEEDPSTSKKHILIVSLKAS